MTDRLRHTLIADPRNRRAFAAAMTSLLLVVSSVAWADDMRAVERPASAASAASEAGSASSANDALKQVERGGLLFGEGRFKLALASFLAALPGLRRLRRDNIITDGHLALIHYNIGLCHEQLGGLSAAIGAMREAAALVPDAEKRGRIKQRIAELEVEQGQSASSAPRKYELGAYVSGGALALIYSRRFLDLQPGTDLGAGARVEVRSGRLGGVMDIGYSFSSLPFGLGDDHGRWDWHSLRAALAGSYDVFGEQGFYLTAGGHLDFAIGGTTHTMIMNQRAKQAMDVAPLLPGFQGGFGYARDWTMGKMSVELQARYSLGSPIERGKGGTARGLALLAMGF